MYSFKFNRNRSGSILVFVLIAFLVIVILTSSVALMFSSNLKMATNQEENMRVHYLLLSGVDLTLSTLLSPLYAEGTEDKSIIDKLRKENTNVTLNDEIDIDGKKVKVNVVYVKDSKEIAIKSSTVLKSGSTKELLLTLEFSGNKFRKIWN